MPEQYEVRDQGVGGSDVAAILGLHPYRTAYDVYLEKVGEHPDQAPRNREALFWGSRLEPVVAQVVAERRERTYLRVGLWVHTEEPWRRVNPDGVLLDEEDQWLASGAFDPPSDPEVVIRRAEVLEVKTTSGWRAKDWADGEAPVAAVLQCLWAMDIGGQRTGVVAGLIGGQQLRTAEVEHDEDLLADVRQRAGEFWFEHVLTRRPPPVVAADRDILRRIYATGGGGVVEADAEAVDAVAEYRMWQQEAARARKRQEAAQARIMAALGDGDELWSGNRRLAHYTTIPGSHVEYDRVERRQLYVTAPKGARPCH